MMSSAVIQLVVGLSFAITATQAAATVSLSVDFLNEDGAQESTFNEGDTAVCRCTAVITADDDDDYEYNPKFEWKRYGSDDRTLIAEGNEIVDQGDERDRFSGVTLTTVDEDTQEYRMTISDLDRYDSGFRFYCKFASQSPASSSGWVAAKMVVNWIPPTAQCSDIAQNVKKGDDVLYACSSVDTDPMSNGSLTISKNGTDMDAGVRDTSPANPTGTQYSINYTAPIADDSIYDVFMCRYNGTGGFEEYSSNCTFNRPKPSCVGDDCITSGALPSSNHVQMMTTVGLPTLAMYWLVKLSEF